MSKGTIHVEYYIRCGGCGWDTRISGASKLQVGQLARDTGWTQSRTQGWICPECSKDKEPEPEQRELLALRALAAAIRSRRDAIRNRASGPFAERLVFDKLEEWERLIS